MTKSAEKKRKHPVYHIPLPTSTEVDKTKQIDVYIFDHSVQRRFGALLAPDEKLVSLILFLCLWVCWLLRNKREGELRRSIEYAMGLLPRTFSASSSRIRGSFRPKCDEHEVFIRRHPCCSPPNGEDCAFCLEHMHFSKSIGNPVARLRGCNHRFHRKCISAWLKDHHTCPLCRMPAEKRDIRPISRRRTGASLIPGKFRNTVMSIGRSLAAPVKRGMAKVRRERLLARV